MKAVHTIDETLAKRGALHLIRNQPSRPILKRTTLTSSNVTVDSSTRPSKPFPMTSQSSRPPQKSFVSFVPWNPNRTPHIKPQPVGIQKESQASNHNIPNRTSVAPMKKVKEQTCEICGITPFHLPYGCPVVAQGSRRCALSSFHLALLSTYQSFKCCTSDRTLKRTGREPRNSGCSSVDTDNAKKSVAGSKYTRQCI